MLVEGRSAHQTGSAGATGRGEGRILPAWGESMRLKALTELVLVVWGCLAVDLHSISPRHIRVVSSLASLHFLAAVDVVSVVLWSFRVPK